MQRIYTESVKTSKLFDTRQALVCYRAVFSVVTPPGGAPPPPPLRDDTESGCVSDSATVPK